MPIRIDGYSERGMVNAVCEDIIRDEDMEQLKTFLSWCCFPFQGQGIPDFSGITSARFLVEQGFSDFGDLDLLILLDHADRKQAILIEAKVATDNFQCIEDRWNDFLLFLQGQGGQASSLFVQIFRKLRLIERVADLDREFELHEIWGRQSLGANPVVRKAARLLAEYCGNPWFVTLIPDDVKRVSEFFGTTLRNYTHDPEQLPGWDISRMGFLTWPDVHQHIQQQPDQSRWKRCLSAFEWNDQQVYQQFPPEPGIIRPGRVGRWNGKKVVVVVPGSQNHRAIPEMTDTAHFPKSFLVPANELELLSEPPVEINPHQPARGGTYTWNPPENDYNPFPGVAVPIPSQLVKVRQAGWHTTRVVLVNEDGKEQGEEFHVFTHHLKRVAS